MAWDIILKSFAVILAIMIVAQLLYLVFGDKSEDETGGEQ